MSTKNSRILSVIIGMLVVGLICVLAAYPYIAEANDWNQDLIRAAENGDLALAQELMGRGGEVNAKDELGATPLMRAAYQGHLEVAKFLIEKGADINAYSEKGWTALGTAASKNRLE